MSRTSTRLLAFLLAIACVPSAQAQSEVIDLSKPLALDPPVTVWIAGNINSLLTAPEARAGWRPIPLQSSFQAIALSRGFWHLDLGGGDIAYVSQWNVCGSQEVNELRRKLHVRAPIRMSSPGCRSDRPPGAPCSTQSEWEPRPSCPEDLRY